jgi:hypothetical protein
MRVMGKYEERRGNIEEGGEMATTTFMNQKYFHL